MTAGLYLFGLFAAVVFGWQARLAVDAVRRHRTLARVRRDAPDLYDWAEEEWRP